MSKILEPEFRKELYKNLVDAGYEKHEAQQMVCKKYYSELHETTVKEIDLFLDSVLKERYDTELDINVIEKVAELRKLKETLASFMQ